MASFSPHTSRCPRFSQDGSCLPQRPGASRVSGSLAAQTCPASLPPPFTHKSESSASPSGEGNRDSTFPREEGEARRPGRPSSLGLRSTSLQVPRLSQLAGFPELSRVRDLHASCVSWDHLPNTPLKANALSASGRLKPRHWGYSNLGTGDGKG